jgi:hypothetical protein
MNKEMKTGNNTLTKYSVNEAARKFLTSDQSYKNSVIDEMLSRQPALKELLTYIDRAVENEMTKEVTIQLMCIFYNAFIAQKVKFRKINFNEILASLSQSAEMKKYLHHPGHTFDGKAFGNFVEQYKQKEILNYTHFALNNQFSDLVKSEQDALFVFYIMKTFGEALDANII